MSPDPANGANADLSEDTRLHVWIDQDLCTGDGLCVDGVPECFVMLEDGIAYVVEDGVALNDPGMAGSLALVPRGREDLVVQAAIICPGECIFIEASEGTTRTRLN
jgi:ferredoxin